MRAWVHPWPALHVSPGQHTSPAPPHCVQLPLLLQARPAPVHAPCPQHGWPTAPHAAHVPFWQTAPAAVH
jgi:hypothetical protein